MKLTYTLRVYIEDTDCTGVVYHSNYLNFFERARSEWTEQVGLGVEKQRADGVYFAIRYAKLDYFRPARLHQQLDVVSSIKEMGKASLVFDQALYLQNARDTVLCQAEIKVVCIDQHIRPRAWPESWIQEFKKIAGENA